MSDAPRGLGRLIQVCLREKLVVGLLTLLLVLGGLAVAPFDWPLKMPRSPVAVDAIPDLGENQQIVFTEWPGRSPQDIQDQITYPLSSALMGVAGVKDVRGQSMFGFSSIAVIFEEDIDFYWSRSRLLEKLNSLPSGALPEGVQASLGPDATALGQIFWYTLEGRDPDGNPAGGWDLHELRTLQDWTVRFGLLSAEGIAEVAGIGGHVREYQVNVNPDALRIHKVTLSQVRDAVADSNRDVGAGTLEINNVEYLVRGVGRIENLQDIEQAVVRTGPNQTPIRVSDVATVNLGPADRRGALDVDGVEAVGGVVTVREGYNPKAAIENVKEQIERVSRGLPSRAVVNWSQTTPEEVAQFAHQHGLPSYEDNQAETQGAWQNWLHEHSQRAPDWLTLSTVTLVPFYDRSELINETLGTLNDALTQQLLVTFVVILVLLAHWRAAVAVGLMLPMAVLITFIGMKFLSVDANIVALAGIAIAIGTIVDMGIIVTDNVLRHQHATPDAPASETVYRGTREVGSAIITAIATTVISFLPVFTMTGAEGKLFTPLAYTKTLVLLASVFLALTLVPATLVLLLSKRRFDAKLTHLAWAALSFGLLVIALMQGWFWVALIALLPGGLAFWHLWARHQPGVQALTARVQERLPEFVHGRLNLLAPGLLAGVVVIVLARVWEPLGPLAGMVRNTLFILVMFGAVLGLFAAFIRFYRPILHGCLTHKRAFLSAPVLLIVFGLNVWLGFDRVFGFIPNTLDKLGGGGQVLRESGPWSATANALPGLGREFMPALDEGAFLWMPSTMPHASIGEVLDVVSQQDRAISEIPEVKTVVGKIGRAETALDPAPLSMLETVIQYHSEFISDAQGRRLNFRYDRAKDEFVRDEQGELIPDPHGRPYRQWRDHVQSPDDIWQEIVDAADLPGTTSAPKLQPIETRLLMLQTGMRAAMGVKVAAPNLESLEQAAMALEDALRDSPGVAPQTVSAERVVGKPWLEIHVDRERSARHGLNVAQVQEAISSAIGGVEVSRSIEGRERHALRVRYQREHRQSLEQMDRVLVSAQDGTQLPLSQLADIRYVRGPQMIRTENTFLTAYVTFDTLADWAEVEVVEAAQDHLNQRLESGALRLAPQVSYHFAGSYEHQVRASQTLQWVVPVSLILIFLLLYWQFRAVSTALIVFSGIAVAWAGGFVMIYFYGQEWFANVSFLGANLREVFQLQPLNLSIAVWVGFLALFGIAVDDGVVMATYLKQHFAQHPAQTVTDIRACTMEAAQRRVRPCLMTSATTILALLPVLTSTGRGSDLMIPMAIPTVGGLTFVLLSMFVVPVLYCWVEEARLARSKVKVQ